MAKGQAKQREKKRAPGRPPGARNKRSRALMLEAEQGVSPADVLLGAMRLYWALVHDEKLGELDRAQARDKAAGLAKEVAPYFHTKLVAAKVERIPNARRTTYSDFTDDERLERKWGSSGETRAKDGEKLH